MQILNASDCADGPCACSVEKALLPFLRQPPTSTYNYSAFLLGSLLGAQPRSAFFLNHYVQLSSTAIYNANHVLAFVPVIGVDDAATVGLGETRSLTPQNEAEAQEMIVAALREGFYARVVLDEFYLPDKLSYRKRHFIHDNLIHGYCPSCQTCLLSGYRTEKASGSAVNLVERFGSSSCPLASLGPAIFSRPGGPKFMQDKIVLFRPAPTPEPLDVAFIKRQLQDYLAAAPDPAPYRARGFIPHAVDPWPGVPGPLSYGLGIYSSLIDFTHRATGTGAKGYLLPYRLLWEHKVGLRHRLNAVVDATDPALLPEVKSRMTAVESAANALRLKALFHRVRSDPQTKTHLIDLLGRLRDEEQALLAWLTPRI